MKSLPLPFLAATLFAASLTPAPAVISWVGGANTDIFDEANWDLSGSAVTTINPNVSIPDDVMIGPGPFTNNPVIPELAGQQRFQLGDGHVLTVTGASTLLSVAGNDGVGGAPGTTNGPTVNVMAGSAFNPFFVVNDVTVNIDAGSTATFGGGGNPINLSTVDLEVGAVLSFLAETPAAYRTEHLSKTTVDGIAAAEGVNITIAAFNGATGSQITAIPEPATSVLAAIALGWAALLRRRRSR